MPKVGGLIPYSSLHSSRNAFFSGPKLTLFYLVKLLKLVSALPQIFNRPHFLISLTNRLVNDGALSLVRMISNNSTSKSPLGHRFRTVRSGRMLCLVIGRAWLFLLGFLHHYQVSLALVLLKLHCDIIRIRSVVVWDLVWLIVVRNPAVIAFGSLMILHCARIKLWPVVAAYSHVLQSLQLKAHLLIFLFHPFHFVVIWCHLP